MSKLNDEEKSIQIIAFFLMVFGFEWQVLQKIIQFME